MLGAVLLLWGCAPPQGDTVVGGTTAVEQPRTALSEPRQGKIDDGGLSSWGRVVAVSRVVDGDTIEVSPAIEGIEDVRLIGVDTPETRHPEYGEQPYGQRASEFTASRLEGRRVALEFDVERVDGYGRLLAYVWTSGGSMFNEALVRRGYAQVATFPPNVEYTDRFLDAQRRARQEQRGLWGLSPRQLCQQTDRGNGIGGCEGEQETRQEGAAPVSEDECPAEAPVKGNISSDGERIFHVPGGQYYRVTDPETCFTDARQARAAGYRASMR